MNDNSKKTIWIAAAVIALVLIVLFGYKAISKRNASTISGTGSNPDSLSDVLPAGEQGSATTTPTTTPASTGTRAAGSTVTASQRYEDAVKHYPYRIQFSQCHGVISTTGSGTLVVKKGSQIMLDNHDAASRTIAFRGHNYKVPGNDFVIGTVTETGTYEVTCDGAGAAQLRVEQ